MERKSETEKGGMERLGFWGVVTLTLRILLANLKHFLCITLLLALPSVLSFCALGGPSKTVQHLKAFISLLYNIIASDGHSHPSDLPPSEQLHPISPSLLFLLLIATLFISWLCTLLLTFSVCRAYLHKSLDLKGSLCGAQRSAKNLILTALMVYGVLVAYVALATFVVMIVAAVLSAMKANVGISNAVVAVGVVGGEIYMGLVFSLAKTVAILEEKKGWEAMSRSMYLIQGSKWRVVGLYIFYDVLSMIVSLGLSVPEEASVVWRWGAGAVMAALRAFIGVCRVASMVVVYMGSKSGHGEPVHTLLAANAEFGPAPQYLDLESAAVATAQNDL